MMIETKRLSICIMSDDEMKQWIEEQSDAGLIAAYREMLQGSLEHPEHREWYAIWRIQRKDGVPVGDLSFKGLNEDGSVEIGYGIREEQRGFGCATEAVAAAVAWALCQPGVTRVEAETEPDNKVSQRVLQKCGFVPTGTIGEEGPRFVKVG